MIVIPGLFVIAGGYRAVVATQTAGGLAAAVGILSLSLTDFSLVSAIPHRMLPELDTPWAPLLSGLAILVLWFTCMDQTAHQRSLAARSDSAIRSGSLLAGLIVAPGLMALAIALGAAPAAPEAGVNSVIAGFIGAGIIASGMASLSGLFMSASTVFTLDLLLANGRSEDDAALVLVGRLANTVVVILAITAASSIALTAAGSLRWMAHAVAIGLPPLVSVTLLGLLWPKMHGRGALWGLLLAWVAGLVHAGIGAEGIGPLMNEVLMTFAAATAVCVGVSLLSDRRELQESVSMPLTHGRLEVRKP
jgi:Na+/proline symporter